MTLSSTSEKGTAISFEPYFVGRNLETVPEKCNAPTNQDKADETQLIEPGELTKLEMSISGKRHERVGEDQ